MRRFPLVMLLVALALAVPMIFLVQRALQSVVLERQMRHQALAERVFDEMERGLSRLLEGEEERPVERYVAAGKVPAFPFIVGHFEVDPDGRVTAAARLDAEERAARRRLYAPEGREAAEVARVVEAYWRAGRTAANARPDTIAQVPGTTVAVDKDAAAKTAADEGESRDRREAKSDASAFDALRSLNKGVQERVLARQKQAAEYDRPAAASAPQPAREGLAAGMAEAPPELLDSARGASDFAPMNGRVIDADHLLLWRTVVRETRAYRQGVLLEVEPLAAWLREQGLGDELAQYAQVSFATPFAAPDEEGGAGAFTYRHRFGDPFADLTAQLALRPLPGVGGVGYVYALAAVMLATGALGLAALYRMVSVVVSFAERRSNFVAAVSHELKTPLTAIRMYGEMLRDGMVTSEAKRDEYHRHITTEAERLSRLINNVLELSLLEKGTRQMAVGSGAVGPVVREAAEVLRAHVEGQGFELRVDVAADLPPVRFEPDALMQVLCNLIDNAVKYGRDASTKSIALRAWREGGTVCVAVRDRGPGVAPRHLGRIFEPFYRGESELTRRNKGTGIGLALVRGLAEQMGARVSGHNVADGGFEVVVAFHAAS